MNTDAADVEFKTFNQLAGGLSLRLTCVHLGCSCGYSLARMPKHPLYPNRYVWFVFLSALDVLFTYLVLWFGGSESNRLANWVLNRFGFTGMIWFKFALVVVVILICEFAGRRNPDAGRLLIHVSLVVTCFPVVLASGLLLIQSWF